MSNLLIEDWPVPGTAHSIKTLALEIYKRALIDRPMTAADAVAVLNSTNVEVNRAIDLLLRLKLIKYTSDSGDQFIGLSPELAQVELATPLEQAISEKRRQLAGIQYQLQSFADTFNQLWRSQLRRDAVVVCGWEETRPWLVDAAHRCNSEVFSMSPAQAPIMWENGPVVFEVIQRGISMRSIFQHTARTEADTRTRAQELASAGAEVRTSNDVFVQLIVFDHEVALVSLPGGGQAAREVVITSEAAIIEILSRIYDHIWHSATKFHASAPVAYGETFDDVKTEILRLLASGLKDDVIARRLGISSRTFRRHLSVIMQELGANSRFQAGIEAARTGQVLIAHPEL